MCRLEVVCCVPAIHEISFYHQFSRSFSPITLAGGNVWNIVKQPLGSIVLGSTLLACLLHIFVGTWLDRVTRRKLQMVDVDSADATALHSPVPSAPASSARSALAKQAAQPPQIVVRYSEELTWGSVKQKWWTDYTKKHEKDEKAIAAMGRRWAMCASFVMLFHLNGIPWHAIAVFCVSPRELDGSS